MQNSTDVVLSRIAALEQENAESRRRARRLRHALVAVSGLGLVVLICGARTGANPHELAAERFVLIDKAGAEVGAFEVLKSGLPGFVMRDNLGHPRLTMGLGPAGEVSLNMYDKEGEIRLASFLNQDGAPVQQLSAKDGLKRLELGVDPRSEGTLYFYGSKDNPLVSIVGFENDAAGIFLHDPTDKQKDRARLVTNGKGQPLFELMDEQGNSLFVVPK